MDLTLLGAGAEQRWPASDCPCASCATAHSQGRHLGGSAVLVDGVLRLGRGVRWDGSDVPLAVGEHRTLGAYDVRALAAGRNGIEGPGVVLDVTGPGGRLLHAPETGPLPPATVQALRGAALDVLLLDETFGDLQTHDGDHLDLVTFPEQLRRLREVGAVTDETDVLAVRLSHENPPPRELARRLSAWGARVLDDEMTLGERPPARPRGRTLVLGGARSGKSREAERLLAAEVEVTYVATAYPPGDDDEWGERVRSHRQRRPAHWSTLETLDLVGLLAVDGAALLVDCLTLWLTRVLDRHDAWDDREWAERGRRAVQVEIDALVAAWRSSRRRVVAVSNEVGQGVVPDTAAGRRFRDLMGQLNAAVAAQTEDVRWCVAGRVQEL